MADRSPSTPGTDPPVVTTARQKLLLVGFGIALFALLLFAVEGLLAAFDVGDPQLYEDPFVGFSESRDLFSKTTRDGREIYATNPGRLRYFDPQEFAVEKPAGGYRVFALGGSTTAGRPYDSRMAFPRWMELYLEEMEPGRSWEVVNAGAISYASYRIVVLMKELVRYEPDLFVIYTGHNEFLEERSYADTIHQNLALKKVRIWLNGFRFYTLARERWLSLRQAESPATVLPGEVDAKLDGWTGLELYRRDDELRRSVVEHFEFNLHQMVAIARDRGVDVIFVRPISNLKDFSPFKSEHAATLSADDKARFDAALDRGKELLAAGRPGEALPQLQAARDLDPLYAEAHFRVGRALFETGDFEDARRALVEAKDLDVAPLRALSEIERVIARVAGEYGLPLIDLPALLEADSRQRYGHGIPGNEYLEDHVHPTPEVHSLIAERLIDRLVTDGVVSRSAEWSSERRVREIFDRVMGQVDPEYYAHRDHNLAKVLAWAGKVEEARAPLERAAAVLVDDPEVRLNLGILHGKAGRWQEAVAELETAVVLASDSADAYFNLGTNLGHLDRVPEAIAALEQAARLRGDDPSTYFNLGALYRRQGDFERASRALARAAELRPNAGEVPRQLGLVYRAQGRNDLAITAFLQALTLDPDDTVARTELGILYGQEGRLEDATTELTRAVASDPGYAEAHYNLGVVYSQRRMPVEAIAAYRRALELDPGRARAHNNLAILLVDQGQLEEARQALTRALEIDPEYAEAWFNLGLVFDRAGRPQEAVRAIERSLELDPDNPRTHFVLANFYQAFGQSERARVHFERARAGGFEAPPG